MWYIHVDEIFCYSLPYARQASIATTFCHLRNISRMKKYISRHIACVQTSPISFVARGTKEIGDVCTQAIAIRRKYLCMLSLLPDWTSVFHVCMDYRNKLSRYFSMFNCSGQNPFVYTKTWTFLTSITGNALVLEERIILKILLMTLKGLNGLAPSYLSDL